MSAYTMNGLIKVVMDEQTFSSGFTKREFVVSSKDEKYPQDIKFEAVQEKLAILEGVGEGDDVSVTFDLRGNEYNGKYYVNLRAWKLEKIEAGDDSAPAEDDRAPFPLDEPHELDDDDALPF